MINFVSPLADFPVGGIRNMFRFTDILNKNYIDSCMYQPGHLNFTPNYFVHQTKLREDELFDPSIDFIILAESFVSRYGPILGRNHLRYGIFVQNQFLIHNDYKNTGTYLDLQNYYENAELIIVHTELVKDAIQFAFPTIPDDKFFHVIPSFARCIEKPKKTKTISYMSWKRLPAHVNYLMFLLDKYLPNNWTAVKIDDHSENDYKKIIEESVIFCSFSDLEGFGMAQVEAVMHENVTIGYTGEGSKAFWDSPCFIEIQPNDFQSYVKEILAAIHRYENNMLYTPEYINVMNKLRARYSLEVEENVVLKLGKKIQEIMSIPNYHPICMLK